MDWQDLPLDAEDELLDRTIRRALQRSLGAAQPSPDVWLRLRRQIAGGPAPRQRPPLTPSPFAPLIQSLAALCLLLVLGVGWRGWYQAVVPGSAPQPAIAKPTDPRGLAASAEPPSLSWADVEGARHGLAADINRARSSASQRPAEHVPRLVALDSHDDLISSRDVAAIAQAQPAAPRGAGPSETGVAARLQPN